MKWKENENITYPNQSDTIKGVLRQVHSIKCLYTKIGEILYNNLVAYLKVLEQKEQITPPKSRHSGQEIIKPRAEISEIQNKQLKNLQRIIKWVGSSTKSWDLTNS